MNDSHSSRLIASAKAYFDEVDSGQLPLELFASDFEFYFPKFGIGRGHDEFREFAGGLWAAGYKARHHRDQLKYTSSGRQVVVEGTTEGSEGDDRTWEGGKTPGGRFCSVFEFTRDGLIERMYIYLDPDYTSLDKDRFHWQRTQSHW